MGPKIVGWILLIASGMILLPNHTLEPLPILIAMGKLFLGLIMYSAGSFSTSTNKTAQNTPNG